MMRKYYLLSACIIGCLLPSCREGAIIDSMAELKPEHYIVSAALPQNAKTCLEGMSVCWSKGDKFEIFADGNYRHSCFVLDSGEGSSEGAFYGSEKFNTCFAKYPLEYPDSCKNGVIYSELPHYQSYADSTFDSKGMIMAAFAKTDERICFNYLCSIIRIPVFGEGVLDYIYIRSKDKDTFLVGGIKIVFNEGTPRLEMIKTNSSSPVLEYSIINYQLNQSEEKDFFVCLPSQLYKDGLRFEFLGEGNCVVWDSKPNLYLESGRIYSIPSIEMMENGGVTSSNSVKGVGSNDSPFIISSVGDLLYMKQIMQTKSKVLSSDNGKYYGIQNSYWLLTKDLDIGGCCGKDINTWMPISSDSPFVFDGGHHKITGLFSDDSMFSGGLFGNLSDDSVIKNLEVEGHVSRNSASIICNRCGHVENCISRGSVHGQEYAGGIGVSINNIKRCVNYASVYSNHSAGISLFTENVNYCVNYGSIEGRAAGICFICHGIISNSINYGDINPMPQDPFLDLSGDFRNSSGISEEVDGKMVNCCNRGKVYSLEGGYAAGISFWLLRDGLISNCVNIGELISNNGKIIAGICSKNYSKVENSYWLETEGINEGVIGGTYKNVFCLSKGEMSGEEHSGIFYSANNDVVDALNAWAADNIGLCPMHSWKYYEEDGLPIINSDEVPFPGEKNKVLKTNNKSLRLYTIEQNVTISIVSSSEISIDEIPSWMRLESISTNLGGGFYNIDVTFHVAQNTSGSIRNGNMLISNSDELDLRIPVTQEFMHLSTDYSMNNTIVKLQSAKEGAGIDLVFLGDAYSDEDISNGSYLKDIQFSVDSFFSVEPYKTFRNCFNVYCMYLVSPVSGLQPFVQSSLYSSVDGVVISGSNSTIAKYCKRATNKDVLDDVTAIVILNYDKSAGTCYMKTMNYETDYGLGFAVAYCSKGSSEFDLQTCVNHEVGGHAFGKLMDEYVDYPRETIPSSMVNLYTSEQKAGYWKNVDFINDPFTISWSKFLQDDRYGNKDIGIFEGGALYGHGVFRPSNRSIMVYNVDGYNLPSREAIYYKIHKLAYGDSWEYSYEDFVKYDEINKVQGREIKQAISCSNKEFKPFASPVVNRNTCN